MLGGSGMPVFAAVGDRIIVTVRNEFGDRVGRIVESPRPDGQPPYLVRRVEDRSEVPPGSGGGVLRPFRQSELMLEMAPS